MINKDKANLLIENLNSLKNTICIHKIDCGSSIMPCHIYANETSDLVHFIAMRDLEYEDVLRTLCILFGDVCNLEYSPLTGQGLLYLYRLLTSSWLACAI